MYGSQYRIINNISTHDILIYILITNTLYSVPRGTRGLESLSLQHTKKEPNHF